VFWDLYGEQGHPIRTTISEMGPLLLARLMGLNETQEGVLTIAFRYADDNGLLLIDLPICRPCWPPAQKTRATGHKYGNVTKASVGAIQRQLLGLESQGADRFFGEPAFEIHDFLHVDENGRAWSTCSPPTS
jgi:DNA helicase HerA-like ATPase